jgi:hypothetical protein
MTHARFIPQAIITITSVCFHVLAKRTVRCSCRCARTALALQHASSV